MPIAVESIRKEVFDDAFLNVPLDELMKKLTMLSVPILGQLR